MDLETQIALTNEVMAVQLGVLSLEQVPEAHRLAVDAMLMTNGTFADPENRQHVVHVTAAPVAEDAVWCETCEEWVTAGAPENHEEQTDED